MPPMRRADLISKEKKQMITWLQGKKTYILVVLAYVYVISGYLTGHIATADALHMLWNSSVIGALRSAVASIQA